jgi:hypothetical protein
MYKGLVAAAVLLLLSGLAVTFLPLYLPSPPRSGGLESVGTRMTQMQMTLAQVKQLAEQINAPLSVIVALMSLYYSRRGYMVQKRRAEER